MKKQLCVPVLFLLFWCSSTFAAEMIKVVPTGDNVNVRTAPSTKGKVHQKVDREFFALLVNPKPITNNTEKSDWYRVRYIFSDDGGDSMLCGVPEGVEALYISARFVREAVLSESEKDHLQWHRENIEKKR